MEPIPALELFPIEIWQHIDTFMDTNSLYKVIKLPKGKLYNIRATYNSAEHINKLINPDFELILRYCPMSELNHINTLTGFKLFTYVTDMYGAIEAYCILFRKSNYILYVMDKINEEYIYLRNIHFIFDVDENELFNILPRKECVEILYTAVYVYFIDEMNDTAYYNITINRMREIYPEYIDLFNMLD